jgi:AmmeMemoRadiSam system protein B
MAATAHHVRIPAAHGFYPGDCRVQLTAFLKDSQPPPDLPQPLHGAVLPHAGWKYSGRVAARTLNCFRSSLPPEIIIIFGAVHNPGVTAHSLYPAGQWETPLGNLQVDHQCGTVILAVAGAILQADPDVHRYEHSIEVLTPMVKYFFPDTSLVPIMVLPQPSATLIGAAAVAGAASLERRAIFLASSDLTHYGLQFGMAPVGTGPPAKAWMEANDQRIIEKLCHDTGESVLNEALANRSACGAGALAALKGAMAALGIPEGHLVQYATSFDMEDESVFQRAVGYAGIVF